MWYVYTMEFYSVRKKNEILSFADKWNWRISSEANLARLTRPKAACSPSYVDCRTKTNAAILWDTGHTKGRLCKGRIR
jgi:hypothetical protein